MIKKILLTGLLILGLTSFAYAEDWGQYGKDSGRTSYSPVKIIPPLIQKWGITAYPYTFSSKIRVIGKMLVVPCLDCLTQVKPYFYNADTGKFIKSMRIIDEVHSDYNLSLQEHYIFQGVSSWGRHGVGIADIFGKPISTGFYPTPPVCSQAVSAPQETILYDGVIYNYGATCKYCWTSYCVSASSFENFIEPLWSHPVTRTTIFFTITHGVFIEYDNTFYILKAYDAKTGVKLWEKAKALYPSGDGGFIYFLNIDGVKVNKVDAQTGNIIWEMVVNAGKPDVFLLIKPDGNTPLIGENTIIYNGNETIGVDKSTGNIRWRKPYHSISLAISKDILWLINSSRQLIAIDIDTGNQMFLKSGNFLNVIIANDLLYAVNEEYTPSSKRYIEAYEGQTISADQIALSNSIPDDAVQIEQSKTKYFYDLKRLSESLILFYTNEQSELVYRTYNSEWSVPQIIASGHFLPNAFVDGNTIYLTTLTRNLVAPFVGKYWFHKLIKVGGVWSVIDSKEIASSVAKWASGNMPERHGFILKNSQGKLFFIYSKGEISTTNRYFFKISIDDGNTWSDELLIHNGATKSKNFEAALWNDYPVLLSARGIAKTGFYYTVFYYNGFGWIEMSPQDKASFDFDGLENQSATSLLVTSNQSVEIAYKVTGQIDSQTKDRSTLRNWSRERKITSTHKALPDNLYPFLTEDGLLYAEWVRRDSEGYHYNIALMKQGEIVYISQNEGVNLKPISLKNVSGLSYIPVLWQEYKDNEYILKFKKL